VRHGRLHDDAGTARHRQDEPRAFRLYVCTGNICRSPFAEILTRHVLVDRLGGTAAAAFHIASAGVRAVAGAPMHPATREELRPWGLEGPVPAGSSPGSCTRG
jgi:protein-tyrosine phosphatase